MRILIFSILFLIFGLCYGEEYFQQHVKYDIEVTLNDTDQTLTAFETLIYKNNSSDTLNFIWFHLWPNAYKSDSSSLAKQFKRLGNTSFQNLDKKDRGFIDSLDFSINGKSVKWEYHSEWKDVAKVYIPDPLLPGGEIKIETPFFVKLPKIVSRLGHSGKHFEITQWYPKPAVYDKDGWHPMPYLNMGEFYSEFGSFDVKITLPQNYRIMATGDMINAEKEILWLDSLALIGDSLKDLTKKELSSYEKSIKKIKKKEKIRSYSKKTIHFRQKNVHDFAWFADPNWIVQKGDLWLADSTKNITLWSMYLPKNAWLWRNSIEYLHDAGLWYSRFYGDYPYNHISAVDGDMSAGGGMEYPNITVISRSGSEDLLEYVIMHEVGHNWFYGMLGSNERDHAWMDEGLNEYTGMRYWSKKYSRRDGQFIFVDAIQNKLGIGKNIDMNYFQYMNYCSAANSVDAQPLNISSDENINYRNYGQNYSKVAVMMTYLQHYIGEKNMDIIMQDYFNNWKYGHPSPSDFILFFRKNLDENIDWFFNNMVDSTTYIDYKVYKKNGKYLLENIGTFNAAVEIAYYDRNNNEVFREWKRPTKKITVLDIPYDYDKVTIDPEQYMPDIDRTNNTTKRGIKTNFIFDKPTYYDFDLNIAPWLFTYNQYNGLAPGIFLFNGGGAGFNGKSIRANVMYDFKNNEPLGGFLIKRKLNDFLSFNSNSFLIGARSLEGRKGAKVSILGLRKHNLIQNKESKINFDIYYHDINESSVNPMIYESGNFLTTSIKYSRNWESNSFNNYLLGSQIWGGLDFCILSVFANLDTRLTKKLKTTIKLRAGTTIISNNLPKQYRYYLGGRVDPDFTSFVIDRTGKSNKLKIIEDVYYGGGIRGLNIQEPYSSSDNMWAIRIDQDIPILPTKLFFDIAGGSDFKEKYYIASGLKLWFFILPLYQSWEPVYKTPNNLNWLRDRIRISIPVFNIEIG